MKLAALLAAASTCALIAASPALAAAPPIPPPAPAIVPALVPLQKYGFSCANTGATNTAIFAAAVATGQKAFSIKNCATPFQLSAPLPVTSDGMTIVGESGLGVTLQPPTNTAGIAAMGAGIWLQNLTIQYASAEPITNTNSACLQVGGSQFLYLSHIQNVICVNSNTGIAATGTNGEFQNTWIGFRMLKFSKYGINETANNSGSSFINTRIQNESSSPGAADCTDALVLTNAFNVTFTTTNIEFLECTNALMALNQSTATFNGLHFEQIALPNFNQMIAVNFQNAVIINDLSIQNSVISDASGQMFNMYAAASSGGANFLDINGFTELGNTFTGKLALFTDDGNFNHVSIKGINGRNSGNVVISTRDSLEQVEGYLFDTPGGRVIAGCVGTAAPTGGMPAPFMSTGGTALSWIVGDRCNNTTPTATSTTGWRNTTAGSPGTFTAEPVL